MKGIIDRFEGNFVVVEIGNKTIDFDKAIFPKEATAGDVVVINGNHVSVLKDETEKRRKEIEKLMDDVFE
ncbi:DUF3006 domain-containing protein [Peribacillus butanolivorans]|uniref:DUF3006 domain-containing protein n=1 Tax=Peribacillus butanolivorans TaxID=421767 RepID=UPI0036DAE1E3